MKSYVEARARLNESGRIVIPVAIRQKFGLQPGDEVLLLVDDGEIRMTTAIKRAERAQRMYQKYVGNGANPVDELIADRRKEASVE